MTICKTFRSGLQMLGQWGIRSLHRPEYIVTCALCKAGKCRPLISTSNLQISQTFICLLLNDLTQAHNSVPHQSLLQVPTSVKLMTTTLQLSCSNIVVQKSVIVCPSWSPIASQPGSARLFWVSHP